MKRIGYMVYEDLKTAFDNLSVKATILSILLICVAPYAIVGWSSGLSDQIGDPIQLFVVAFQIVIPYISLRVSYGSISSEIDTNTHRLLLTMPVSRLDLVVSKFLSRTVFVNLGIVMYSIISMVVSPLLYTGINTSDALIVGLVSMGLSVPFVALGVCISCTTDYSSIFSQLKITLVYAPLVYMWRLIPVLIEILFTDSGFLSPPDGDYAMWQYFILRINPIETHASLVQSMTGSDINIIMPSSLFLPDLNNGRFIEYPGSPLKVDEPAFYVEETVTVFVSIVFPLLFLAYGYIRFRRREF